MEEKGISVEKEYFRILEEGDMDAWFEVLKEGYKDLKDLPISFEAIHATKQEAAEWFETTPFYGLFKGDRLAASVGIRMPWGPKPGPKGLPHIGWVVTHPDFKGTGCAKRLLQHLEKEVLIKQLRAPGVTLGTAKEHPWLTDMYQSFGFVPFKTVQLNGKLHHTVFMEKKLETTGRAEA